MGARSSQCRLHGGSSRVAGGERQDFFPTALVASSNAPHAATDVASSLVGGNDAERRASELESKLRRAESELAQLREQVSAGLRATEEEEEGETAADCDDTVPDFVTALESLPEDGVLGVYFSADVAAPLRASHELLKERFRAYTTKGLPFAVLWVPLDRAESAVLHEGLCWTRMSGAGPRRQITLKMDVHVVPSLILVSKGGSIISREGLGVLAGDEDGERFPWHEGGNVWPQELSRPASRIVRFTGDGSPGGSLNTDSDSQHTVSSDGFEVVAEELESPPITGHSPVRKAARSVSMLRLLRPPRQSDPGQLREPRSSDPGALRQVGEDTGVSTMRKSKTMSRIPGVTDDESLKKRAEDLQLSEEGYSKAANLRSNYAMREYVKRVAADQGYEITDKEVFQNLMWQHSGIVKQTSLKELCADLQSCTTRVSLPPTPRTNDMDKSFIEENVIAAAGAPSLQLSVEGKTATPDAGLGAAGSTGDGGNGLCSSDSPDGSTGLDGDMPGQRGSAGPGLAGKGSAGKAHGGKGSAPTDADAKGPSPRGLGPKGLGPKGPEGKGPTGSDKGKSKGKGKGKGRLAPTRTEKADWVGKSRVKLKWKRLLKDQEDFDSTLFGKELSEVPVELHDLAHRFQVQAAARKKHSFGEEAALDSSGDIALKKSILWEEVGNVDAMKRSMALKATLRKFGEEFFSHLEHFEFEAIIDDTGFNIDDFSQLTERFAEFTVRDRQRLLEIQAETTYIWDPKVEGLARQLVRMPLCEIRLNVICGHLKIIREQARVEEKVERIHTGISAILEAEGLAKTPPRTGALAESHAISALFRKILTIGNCLNAGDAKLGRADGFDAIDLCVKSGGLLQGEPKGNDRTPLLAHVGALEAEELKEDLHSIALHLKGWRSTTGQCDQEEGDLGEVQGEATDVERELGELKRSLDAALAQGSEGDALAGLEQDARDREAMLERFQVVLREHCARFNRLQASLDALKDESGALEVLQRHLGAPLFVTGSDGAKKRDLAAGRILGAIAQLIEHVVPAAVYERAAERRRRSSLRCDSSPISGGGGGGGGQSHHPTPRLTARRRSSNEHPHRPLHGTHAACALAPSDAPALGASSSAPHLPEVKIDT